MVLAHNIVEVQRTKDIQICEDTTFDTMMLSPNILTGLQTSGFIKPSPIQLLGIPLGKLGLDLLLEAKSGTGKTVVFSTIALEKLNLSKGLQVVIITPTREIAVQISDVLKQIGSKCEGLTIEVVIGGLPYHEDVEKLKQNVHILVGTPGRLKYLIQDKHIETSAIRLFILDEADKLMEASFQDDIKYIHSALPKQKQVIMSSATYPETVMHVINELVQDAQHVCPNSSNVLLGVSHKVTYVMSNSNSVRQTEIRFEELTKILTETQFKQCVIFCKYQARVSQLHKMLTKAKWPSELVYGKQDQVVRLDALKTLQEYKCRILISTDLVSRGIDAKNVDLVINFEPPDTCETYLHRIGRSGRYGSIGMAISIVSEGVERKYFHAMLEPIINSINLENYWTGEHFDHCMNENNLQLKISDTLNDVNRNLEETHDYENLWKFIIGHNEESEEIESFEDLCLSYKKIDKSDSDKIESFSDLLQSYQNISNDINKEETIEYKQMNFDNMVFRNYINNVRNLKEKFETSITHKTNKIKSNCESHSSVHIMQDTKNAWKGNLVHKMIDENGNSIKKKLEINGISEGVTSNNNHLISITENYIDADDFISQLPESFHKSAYKNHYKNKNTMNQHESTKKGISHIIKKVKPDKRSCSSNNQAKQAFMATLCKHEDDGLYYDEKETKHVHKGNLNVKPSIDKTSFGYNTQSSNYNDEINRQTSYYQWYNQLKSNVKHIEQYLYISEMSKP
ncbi:probable ATP-dependent RNA helicase DDX20 [Zerene cesonia]|uniref:probable ATP-dependent RNA helicase DDX20 n=1 Tax=Zerene cesonia TaxID=33412 RepID=UPI0018E4EBD1|nr:probable ATP-dependent RNA helicase DDX20 [Zerene cesonia]